MEIKAADVAKLRKMTGAGMMDCKKALVEANGDYEKAKEIIREKGKLVAAKRSDRETTEGSVIAKVTADNKKAILVSLGCETDFVANNEEFKALAEDIANTAINNYPADLEALKACKLSSGITVEEGVTQQTGKSGEKHAIPYYSTLEAGYIASYIHINHKVGAIVGFNKPMADAHVGKEIAMQVTAMNPVSLTKDDCPKEVIEKELEVAVEKTKEEMDTFYGQFFDKVSQHMAPGGVIIMYTNEEGFVKKQLRLHENMKLLDQYLMQEKNGFYLMIMEIRG